MPASGAMSKSLRSNWDIAVASSALLLIVGGVAAPHIKRLIGKQREAELGDGARLPERAPEQLLHA